MLVWVSESEDEGKGSDDKPEQELEEKKLVTNRNTLVLESNL